MTPDQVHLLRKSFARIEPQAQIVALAFYRRLFELAPEIRSMFKAGIEEQSSKLVDMLKLAVNLTDRPGSLETELRELGARHLGYGVKDAHYEAVDRALMDTLGGILGTDFTPAVRAAWSEFFQFMADLMKQGAVAADASGTAEPALSFAARQAGV